MKREAFVASLKRKAQFRSVNASNANIIFLEKGLVKKKKQRKIRPRIMGIRGPMRI